MTLAILIIAFTAVFALGVAFGLWVSGQLSAAPIIENADSYCAHLGAKEADAWKRGGV